MAIIDWVFLGLYFALLIVIGVQTIRRIETPEDFAVAGNRIIWPVVRQPCSFVSGRGLIAGQRG